MDIHNTLNLALVFPQDHARLFESFSQEWHGIMPSTYVLGVNSLPHISVLQFHSADTPETIWQKVKAMARDVTTVDANGIYIEQGSSGNFWHGLRITGQEALTALQSRLADAVQPDHIFNGTGAPYFPHITTGRTPATSVLPALPFRPEISMLSSIPCSLALGRSGPYGQFEELLFS